MGAQLTAQKLNEQVHKEKAVVVEYQKHNIPLVIFCEIHGYRQFVQVMCYKRSPAGCPCCGFQAREAICGPHREAAKKFHAKRGANCEARAAAENLPYKFLGYDKMSSYTAKYECEEHGEFWLDSFYRGEEKKCPQCSPWEFNDELRMPNGFRRTRMSNKEKYFVVDDANRVAGFADDASYVAYFMERYGRHPLVDTRYEGTEYERV